MTVRSILIFLSFMLFIILTGCVTLLSERGSRVRFEESIERVENCKYLGTVKGTSPAGLVDSLKKENALNNIRNNAALLGANTVVIISRDSMFDETVVMGKAYHCPLSR